MRSERTSLPSPSRLVFLAAVALMSPACTEESGESCAVGSEGCSCTSGDACDAGLSCRSGLCVRLDGEDSGTDSTTPGGGNSTGQGGSTSNDSDSDSNGGDTTSAGEGSTTTEQEPAQPFGTCWRECDTVADCPTENPSNMVYACVEGLCVTQCQATCEREEFGFLWSCIEYTMAPAGTGYCGLGCDGNTCEDFGGIYHCYDRGATDVGACSPACDDPEFGDCNGATGFECLGTGQCGCYDDSDCLSGYGCYRNW